MKITRRQLRKIILTEIRRLDEISTEKQVKIYNSCLKRHHLSPTDRISDVMTSLCLDEAGEAYETYIAEKKKYLFFANQNQNYPHLQAIRKMIETGNYSFDEAKRKAEAYAEYAGRISDAASRFDMTDEEAALYMSDRSPFGSYGE